MNHAPACLQSPAARRARLQAQVLALADGRESIKVRVGDVDQELSDPVWLRGRAGRLGRGLNGVERVAEHQLRGQLGHGGRVVEQVDAADASIDAFDAAPTARGGPVRGTLLHKLIEEVLTGEAGADADALEARAVELMQQLGLEPSTDAANSTSPEELAVTVLRTMTLPAVADMSNRLEPETAVRSAIAGNSATAEIVVSGVADAVALNEEGGIDAVIDWKSDVAPETSQREHHRGQVREYLRAIGATRGMVVYMTLGQIEEVSID